MKGIIPALRKLDNGDIVPIGYHCVNFHMIFDVNMEDLCRKARLVAGGYVTDTPSTITYTSIVSWETVRIDLTLYALNDLPAKVEEIKIITLWHLSQKRYGQSWAISLVYMMAGRP